MHVEIIQFVYAFNFNFNKCMHKLKIENLFKKKMFYEENEIKALVTCPYCQNKYNDPRFIECGTTFCMECIELLTKTNENGFQCPECGVFHLKPANGYFKNNHLAKLCEKKASFVSRGSISDTLRAQLDKLKLNLDKLNTDNKLGADKIEEYCLGLRNEVQLSSEELIESIKKYNMELIEQINEFELESLLNFDKKIDKKLDHFIDDMFGFHSKWSGYLKQFELDDTELRTASNQAEKYLKEISSENGQLLDRVFSSGLIEFRKNSNEISSSILGTLKARMDYGKCLDSLSSYFIYDLDRRSSSPVSIQLNNERIYVAYIEKFADGYLSMSVYDKKLKSLLKKKLKFGNACFNFNLNKLASSIIVCFSEHSIGWDSRNDEYQDKSMIAKLDPELNTLKQVDVGFKLCDVDVFNGCLYCLSWLYEDEDEGNRRIYVYNEDLVELTRIGDSSSENGSFYIPKSASKIRVNQDYFVLLDDSGVLVMSRGDGLVRSRFSINSEDFVLDPSADCILTYSNESNKVVCFDFNGKSKSFGLSKSHLREKSRILECLDQKIVFYDPYSLYLYF